MPISRLFRFSVTTIQRLQLLTVAALLPKAATTIFKKVRLKMSQSLTTAYSKKTILRCFFATGIIAILTVCLWALSLATKVGSLSNKAALKLQSKAANQNKSGTQLQAKTAKKENLTTEQDNKTIKVDIQEALGKFQSNKPEEELAVEIQQVKPEYDVVPPVHQWITLQGYLLASQTNPSLANEVANHLDIKPDSNMYSSSFNPDTLGWRPNLKSYL